MWNAIIVSRVGDACPYFYVSESIALRQPGVYLGVDVPVPK